MLVVGSQKMKSSGFSDEGSRYQAFHARDAAADGCFIIAVKTTGIYCRPVCSARPPKRENIEFFDTIGLARRAGYRACLRCKPDDAPVRARLAAFITRACRRLENSEVVLSVEELARGSDMSAGRFHRVFKQATGLSPKQYALAHRVESFRGRLSRGEGVTSALYNAGFNASSRAYEASRRLGAKPNDVKTGGVSLVVSFGVARCSLGYVGFGLSARGLCALAFGDTAEEAQEAVQARLPKARLLPMSSSDRTLVTKIVQLVDRPSVAQDLPLDIQGTAFQERVWQALRKIPMGSQRSYADIAKEIGNPSAHRAVANACGANKIAVAIPCHRVIASGGGIGGYAFGVERKKKLLAKESRK